MSQKFALVIGNNQHDAPAWHDLKTPELDAEARASVLEDARIGGFDRVVRLLNAHLHQAFTLAEQIGLPGEQWQILAKLGELYGTAGEEAQARQALDRVTDLGQALTAGIGAENLRAEFWQIVV